MGQVATSTDDKEPEAEGNAPNRASGQRHRKDIETGRKKKDNCEIS